MRPPTNPRPRQKGAKKCRINCAIPAARSNRRSARPSGSAGGTQAIDEDRPQVTADAKAGPAEAASRDNSRIKSFQSRRGPECTRAIRLETLMSTCSARVRGPANGPTCAGKSGFPVITQLRTYQTEPTTAAAAHMVAAKRRRICQEERRKEWEETEQEGYRDKDRLRTCRQSRQQSGEQCVVQTWPGGGRSRKVRRRQQAGGTGEVAGEKKRVGLPDDQRGRQDRRACYQSRRRVAPGEPRQAARTDRGQGQPDQARQADHGIVLVGERKPTREQLGIHREIRRELRHDLAKIAVLDPRGDGHRMIPKIVDKIAGPLA